MTQPLPEVDTSLQDGSMPTGREGIDAPGFEPMTMRLPGLDEFQSAFPAGTSNFQMTHTTASGDRAAVVDYAKQFLGTPYDWGGTDLRRGVDCSGFTQQVWKKFGVNLPRVSQDQANVGEHVDISKLQPGDLVLFPGSQNGGRQGPGHVALYMGNGQILEAPHAGAAVRIAPLAGRGRVFGVHINYGS